MTDNSLNPAERSLRRIALSWLLFPLALFPLVALLTYDWRAIDTLKSPPMPSTNWIGALGDGFAYYGYTVFGLAIWMVPVMSVIAGLCLICGRRMRPGRRELWFLMFLSSLSCIIQVVGDHAGAVADITAKINIHNAGGAIGHLLMTRCLSPLLSDFGASVLMVLLMLVSLIAAVGAGNIASFFSVIAAWAVGDGQLRKGPNGEIDEDKQAAYLAAIQAKEEAKRQREAEKAAVREEKQRIKDEKRRLKEELKAQREAERNAARGFTPPQAPPIQTPLPAARPATAVRNTAPVPANSQSAAVEPDDKGPYILPSLSLLNPLTKTTADHSDVGEMSKRLIDTLKIFNVDASLAYTIQGPVVTKYAVQLAPGTRYNVVTNISDNLMGALHAKSLRIEAPIPGEDCIGIEVPNRSPAGISFREIIESDAWRNFKGELPLLFGKDAAGKELVADLAKMPHMLVAGATGQGKSVCLNAIINGLLMTKTPEQLKLIMVDPKSVEFTSYVSIPHLIVPIITENRKVVFALHWAVAEMEKRLKLFARAKVRNIYDFNHRLQFTQTDMFGNDTEVGTDMPKTVPYIVIIIDEVADLMAAAAKDVVPDISRLTAKARAAGIHLILATQRPDAKVITGTIKANIPGRVAFKTATGIDSRTILDEGGAENLIGKGDMLFRTAEGILIRAQGAWISDPEIARITNFIEQHANPQFDEKFAKKLGTIKEAEIDPFADADGESEEPKESAPSAREMVKAAAEADDFKKAIECIINTNRASTSHFQRRMGWGYNHAAKILDLLEQKGIVSPQQGAGPRQILMDQQQLLDIFNGGESSQPPQAAPDAPPADTDDDQMTLITEEV